MERKGRKDYKGLYYAIKTITFIFILSFCFSGKGQVFEYHPSLALSSGLGFSSNMTNETSFLFRNEFTNKSKSIVDFCKMETYKWYGKKRKIGFFFSIMFL